MFTTWVTITASKCCHNIMMKQNNIKWLDAKGGVFVDVDAYSGVV
jgi:hypothetical protein